MAELFFFVLKLSKKTVKDAENDRHKDNGFENAAQARTYAKTRRECDEVPGKRKRQLRGSQAEPSCFS
jgi:hypothetical protein